MASTANPSSPVGPLSTLKNITHVCRYWREAALDSPVLWASCFHHLTYDRNWMKTILIRSAPYALDLRIHTLITTSSNIPAIPVEKRPVVMENAMLVIEEYSRVREINIVASESDALQILQRAQGPAPVLHSLQITTSQFTGPWDYINIGPTPVLQHLSLTNSPIGWNSSLFRSKLIHLEISLEIAVPSHLTSTSSLLDVLDGLPSLQTLVLSNIFTPQGLHQVPKARIVSLPQLYQLSLSVHLHTHVRIVGHLSFPESTTLHISITRRGSAADAFALLKQHFNFEFSRVDLKFHETGLAFRGWQSDVPSEQPRLLMTSSHTCPWNGSSIEEFSQFMPLLPLQGIRDFCYTTESFLPSFTAIELSIAWGSVVDRLTSLESLTLCGSESSIIVNVLDTRPDISLPLQKLKQLIFKESSFLKSRYRPHPDWYSLIKMLNNRADRNKKLETLVFYYCRLPSARINEAQNAV